MNIGNLDELVFEVHELTEKSARLMSKSKRLLENIDNQCELVVKHSHKLKKLLGTVKPCPICCKDSSNPDYCIDICHHIMCEACAKRCLRSEKCFICRSNVNAIFKVFF